MVVYRQWHRGGFSMGLGFDTDELFRVGVGIDLCPQHLEFSFSLNLLGGSIDLFWMK